MNKTTNLYDFAWDIKIRVFIEDEIRTMKCGWERQVIVATHVKGNILNEYVHEYMQWFDDYVKYYQMFEMRYVDNGERFRGI